MPQYNTEKLKEAIRIGAYAIAIKNNSILLVNKIKGPYTGLMDLPGGGIESGEHPEDTLKREFAEEVAMEFTSMSFIERRSFQFEANLHFYHYGYLYQVYGLAKILNSTPEETFAWHPIQSLDPDKLTPFARAAIETLQASNFL